MGSDQLKQKSYEGPKNNQAQKGKLPEKSNVELYRISIEGCSRVGKTTYKSIFKW